MKQIKAYVLIVLCAGLLQAARMETKTGPFSENMVLTGFLQAKKAEHFIVPRSNSWQIQLKWMAPEGSLLEPGQVAVRFDTSNLASEIENLELTLEDKLQQKKQKVAECQMEEINLDLQFKMAKIDVQKKKLDSVIPKGIISDYEFEKNQLELKKSEKAEEKADVEKTSRLEQMRSEIQRLEIEIQEARDKLRQNQHMLDGLTLKAQNRGTLMYAEHPWQHRKLQIGDNVAATWTVATIPDNSSLYVEAWAGETGVKSLKPGIPVDIVMDAYPHVRFEGVIEDVMNNAEKKNYWGRSHYFQIKIALKKLDDELMKPGMSVMCDVKLRTNEEVLLVPLEMVHFDGGDYWIQVSGNEPMKLKAGIIGQNEFFLALDPGSPPGKGAILEPVEISSLREAGDETR